jgi:hypothetical protein
MSRRRRITVTLAGRAEITAQASLERRSRLSEVTRRVTDVCIGREYAGVIPARRIANRGLFGGVAFEVVPPVVA